MSTQLQITAILLIALVCPFGAEDAVEEDQSSEDPCHNKKEGCCSELYMGNEEDLMQCVLANKQQVPPKGDIVKTFKFLSCLVECQFKRRKYIGKGDTVNMKMVKSDAEKLYPGRPKESAYYVEMFEFCRRDGKAMYEKIQQNSGGRVLLVDTCKPYFTFVFFCNAQYHKHHHCPYFRWQAQKLSPAEAECSAAKTQCYERDGIAPP